MPIKRLLKNIARWFLLIITTIALTIVLKVFFIASFKIPTPSMVPAILPGDHILVNKLIIGPRIYRSAGFLGSEKAELFRIKGLRPIRRNDVLVFNFPYSIPDKLEADLGLFFVKRCVGIPGDTLSIENGIYKVQGYPDPLGLYERQVELSRTPDETFRKEVFQCFPYDTVTYNWNIKNFGPLYIPGKGDRIELNATNVLLYKNLIRYETDRKVSLKEGEIYIGKERCTSYTFRENYYFMAGDWGFDSQDSRYWGLLPEELVIGKATVIWKSNDPYSGKFRWERFLKRVQ